MIQEFGKMSLSHILGKTPEIKIVDFLMENLDRCYTHSEITECTGLPDNQVIETIKKLVENNVVCEYRQGYFSLTNNDIKDGLMLAVYSHSFIMAGLYERHKKEVKL
jgi:hypothetical protein